MSEGIIIKSDGNKTLAQIQAEVAAFEANPVDPGAPDVSTPPVANAPAPVTPPEKAATPDPGTPPATEPAKPTQQPQETAEKVVSETPKATEPVKDWEAAYKGLQRTIDKVQKENSELKAGTPKAQEAPIEADVFTPESKARFSQDVEKDPVEAIARLVRSITAQEVTPLKSKFEANEAEKLEASRIASLDALAKEGHEWLKTTDGIEKMKSVMVANPELWKTKDPYRAALGFIPDLPSKAGQRGPAQSTGLTPILGAAGAMPPTVSAPAMSKMAKLESLQQEVVTAQSRGQWDKAGKLLKEMDEIDRGY
jgi:hypothetical protein